MILKFSGDDSTPIEMNPVTDDECPVCKQMTLYAAPCNNSACQDGYVNWHKFDPIAWPDPESWHPCDDCDGNACHIYCENCHWTV